MHWKMGITSTHLIVVGPWFHPGLWNSDLLIYYSFFIWISSGKMVFPLYRNFEVYPLNHLPSCFSIFWMELKYVRNRHTSPVLYHYVTALLQFFILYFCHTHTHISTHSFTHLCSLTFFHLFFLILLYCYYFFFCLFWDFTSLSKLFQIERGREKIWQHQNFPQCIGGRNPIWITCLAK